MIWETEAHSQVEPRSGSRCTGSFLDLCNRPQETLACVHHLLDAIFMRKLQMGVSRASRILGIEVSYR
jgi:hypothetical protein